MTKKWLNFSVLSGLISVLGMAMLYSWYSGNDALSEAEINQFLRQLSTLDEPQKSFIQQTDVKAFLADDNGEPFYVVNFFRFKPAPGPERFEQFSKTVVPLWIRFGSHPIFSSTAFIPANSSWDRMTVVRYRSRRDWIEIVSSQTFTNALPLRLEATEENTRFTLSAILIPNLFLLVTIIFSAGLGIVYSCRRLLSKK